MIGLLLAAAAILSQPQPIPADFYADMAAGHEVVILAGEASSLTSEPGATPEVSVMYAWRGWEWQCGDEMCYAGIDVATGEWQTGP